MTPKRRIHIFLLLAILLPIVALLGIKQGEGLWIPESFQSFSTAIYRILFVLKVPFEVLFSDLLPTVDHHGNPYRTLVACICVGIAFAVLVPMVLYLLAHRRAKSKDTAGKISRRLFFAESLAGAAVAVMTGTAAHAMLIAPHRIRVRNYEVLIRDLPPSLHGLRIAQLSDTHYGPFMPMSYIKHAIAEVNALEPDFIALTGDYVHKTPRAIPDGIGVLQELKAPLGVVAVLGNHDYWEGLDACRAVFSEIGIPLLENKSVSLSRKGLGDVSNFDESICIAGVVDIWEDQPDVVAAKVGVPNNTPTILLSHNPDYAEQPITDVRVDLMLSGHTHGGQVRIPGWGTPIVPSRFGQKYSGGLVNGPQWPVIVNRGVGMAALPVRFRVPPEVCLITLKGA